MSRFAFAGLQSNGFNTDNCVLKYMKSQKSTFGDKNGGQFSAAEDTPFFLSFLPHCIFFHKSTYSGPNVLMCGFDFSA